MSSLLCSVPVLVHIGMVLLNYDASDTDVFVFFAVWVGSGVAGGCDTVSPGPRSGSGRGLRCPALHADPHHACTLRLEASEEAGASEGNRRVGGDYAETCNKIDDEEVGHGGVRLRGPCTSDAHAEERGGKRIRTSASGYDAGIPTYELMWL